MAASPSSDEPSRRGPDIEEELARLAEPMAQIKEVVIKLEESLKREKKERQEKMVFSTIPNDSTKHKE